MVEERSRNDNRGTTMGMSSHIRYPHTDGFTRTVYKLINPLTETTWLLEISERDGNIEIRNPVGVKLMTLWVDKSKLLATAWDGGSCPTIEVEMDT